MKVLKKSLTIVILLFLCVFSGQYVFGADSTSEAGSQVKATNSSQSLTTPYHRKHPKASCFRNLGLDDKQKSEVRKIYEVHKPQIDSLWAELDRKTEILHEAIKTGDEQNIRKAFQDVSKIRENMLILRLSILKEIKNILSDSQKSQLEACLKQRFDRVHKKWEKELMRFLSE